MSDELYRGYEFADFFGKYTKETAQTRDFNKESLQEVFITETVYETQKVLQDTSFRIAVVFENSSDNPKETLSIITEVPRAILSTFVYVQDDNRIFTLENTDFYTSESKGMNIDRYQFPDGSVTFQYLTLTKNDRYELILNAPAFIDTDEMFERITQGLTPCEDLIGDYINFQPSLN